MAKKIKLSEIFLSYQCEGRYVGRPSIFVRAFGCNFTCGGFGMPVGKDSQERFQINPDNYDDFNELPVVHTGCDSYASWDPRFKKFSKMYTIDELSDKIHNSLLPEENWKTSFGQHSHLILTGGEPLLPGWQKFWSAYIAHEHALGLRHVTFETNGTQTLRPELEKTLRDNPELEVTFSVAAKLSNSGEPREEAIRPDIVSRYSHFGTVFLKFVTEGEQDMPEIIDTVNQFHSEGGPYEVYLMPVGGTDDLYFKTKTPVANLALKYGFHYSPRLQVDLWNNQWSS